MKKLTYCFWALLFIALFTCTSRNKRHWLQFRGPNATGIANSEATPPTDFGIENNVLWKIEIPEGLSSPIIIDNNLILTGVNLDEKKYLICDIDSENGTIKWEKEVAVENFEEVHNTSSPAAATPVSDGERIYCYFPSFGLICLDLAGNKVWEKPINPTCSHFNKMRVKTG